MSLQVHSVLTSPTRDAAIFAGPRDGEPSVAGAPAHKVDVSGHVTRHNGKGIVKWNGLEHPAPPLQVSSPSAMPVPPDAVLTISRGSPAPNALGNGRGGTFWRTATRGHRARRHARQT